MFQVQVRQFRQCAQTHDQPIDLVVTQVQPFQLSESSHRFNVVDKVVGDVELGEIGAELDALQGFQLFVGEIQAFDQF